MSSISDRDKAALAPKLPPKGEYEKKRRKMPKLPATPGGCYTRLSRSELKMLIGSKPRFPVYLDFTESTFQLQSDDFLSSCPNVIKELDMTDNGLVECSSFESLTKLKRVVLDGNNIREVNFSGLVSVVVLSLENNKLEYLPDMSPLKKCVNLNLSGNCLTAGFPQLAKLKSLQVLDLGRNRIEFPLGQFNSLLLKNLVGLPKLKFLSFADNPCETAIKNFRLFVISEMPKLVYLDWKKITTAERAQAAVLAKQGAWKVQPSRASSKMIPSPLVSRKKQSDGSSRSRPGGQGAPKTQVEKPMADKPSPSPLGGEDPSLEDIMKEVDEELGISNNDDLDALLDSLKSYENIDDAINEPDISAELLKLLEVDDAGTPDAAAATSTSSTTAASAQDSGGNDYLSKLYEMVSAEDKSDASPAGLGASFDETGQPAVHPPPIAKVSSAHDDEMFSLLNEIMDGTDLMMEDPLPSVTPPTSMAIGVDVAAGGEAAGVSLDESMADEIKKMEMQLQMDGTLPDHLDDISGALDGLDVDGALEGFDVDGALEGFDVNGALEGLDLGDLLLEGDEASMNLESLEKTISALEDLENGGETTLESADGTAVDEVGSLLAMIEGLEEQHGPGDVSSDVAAQVQEVVLAFRTGAKDIREGLNLIKAQLESLGSGITVQQCRMELQSLAQVESHHNDVAQQMEALPLLLEDVGDGAHEEKLALSQELDDLNAISNAQRQAWEDTRKSIQSNMKAARAKQKAEEEEQQRLQKEQREKEEREQREKEEREQREKEEREQREKEEREQREKEERERAEREARERAEREARERAEREREERERAEREARERAEREREERERAEREKEERERAEREARERAEREAKERAERERMEAIERAQRDAEAKAAFEAEKAALSRAPWDIAEADVHVECEVSMDGPHGPLSRGQFNGERVRVKRLASCPTSTEFIGKLREEVASLSQLRHPGVATLHGASFASDLGVMAISAWVDGHSLDQYVLDEAREVRGLHLVDLAVGLVNALAYLHAEGVVHGALKPGNVMIGSEGTVVLVDGGLSTHHNAVLRGTRARGGAYSPPEVLLGARNVSSAGDVFAVGMMLWVLFARRLPWEGLGGPMVVQRVAEDQQRPAMVRMPYVVNRLVQSAWGHDARKRPSAAVLLKILSQPVDALLKYDGDDVWHEAIVPLGGLPPPPGGGGGGAPQHRSDGAGNAQHNAVISKLVAVVQGSSSSGRLRAFQALLNFARDEEQALAVLASELLPELLRGLAPEASDPENEQTCRCFVALAQHASAQQVLSHTDIVPRILDLVEHKARNPIVASHALQLLATLCESSSVVHEAVIGAQGVPTLVTLLKGPTDMVRLQALTCLARMLEGPRVQEQFYQAQGVHPLISLLRSPNPGLQLRVLEALCHLASNAKMVQIILRVGVLRRLAALMDTPTPALQLQSLQAAKKFALHPELRGDMYASGVVSLLLTTCNDANDPVVLELALDALCSLGHTTEAVADLRPHGGLRGVVRALGTPSSVVRRGAATLLERVMFSQENRRNFIGVGGLTNLVSVLSSPHTSPDTTEALLAVLEHLSQDKEHLEPIGQAGAIGAIVEAVGEVDTPQAYVSGLSVLARAAGAPKNKEIVQDADGVALFVRAARDTKPDVRQLGAMGLANLCDVPACRACVVGEGGLSPLLDALTDGKSSVQQRVLWATSHLAGDAHNQAEIARCAAGPLVALLGSDTSMVQSLALKTVILLCARRIPAHVDALRAAGVEDQLKQITVSKNPTVAMAAKKALTFV